MSRPSHSSKPLFDSFFLAGFECSAHRLACGRRLDLTVSTRHHEFAEQYFARVKAMGMTACRDGVNWVVCERPGEFDFSSVLPRLRAAGRRDLQVVWDLMHFG